MKKLLLLLMRLMKGCIWGITILFLGWILLQTVLFASFKVPTDSMVPALLPGDNIIVNKLPMGARLFNLSAAFRQERFVVYRLPALGGIKRNDVLVFNFPYPQHRDSIGFDILKYYVKRCVALPGDSISIHNYHYCVAGYEKDLGNIKSQDSMKERLQQLPENARKRYSFQTYPWNDSIHWNVCNFGPLYIPRMNDVIVMSRKNYLLYRHLI